MMAKDCNKKRKGLKKIAKKLHVSNKIYSVVMKTRPTSFIFLRENFTHKKA